MSINEEGRIQANARGFRVIAAVTPLLRLPLLCESNTIMEFLAKKSRFHSRFESYDRNILSGRILVLIEAQPLPIILILDFANRADFFRSISASDPDLKIDAFIPNILSRNQELIPHFPLESHPIVLAGLPINDKSIESPPGIPERQARHIALFPESLANDKVEEIQKARIAENIRR